MVDQKDVLMAARVLCTSAVIALAIACFLGEGPAQAGVNIFGISLLIGACIVWFAWPAGYHYGGGETPRRWQHPMTIGAEPLFRAMDHERPDKDQKER